MADSNARGSSRPGSGMEAPPAERKRSPVLDPATRISEVLFGLIMVLTFTGSLSVAEAGREDVRAMLIGALGCNLAWGLIDAILYLMNCRSERARQARTVRAVQSAANAPAAHRIIAEALPPDIAASLESAEFEQIRRHLNTLPPSAITPRLRPRDGWGAVGVFLLVFMALLPVVLPFLFIQDAMLALRVSNAVAVGMLFLLGIAFGRQAGIRPWLMGLAMVVLGGALVALTIALGG